MPLSSLHLRAEIAHKKLETYTLDKRREQNLCPRSGKPIKIEPPSPSTPRSNCVPERSANDKFQLIVEKHVWKEVQ